uniref:Uncharacterized protein n=1 Tax=Anguilla anguilla TaxID=7936 RepID=A0A0E9SH43_ANGAN
MASSRRNLCEKVDAGSLGNLLNSPEQESKNYIHKFGHAHTHTHTHTLS